MIKFFNYFFEGEKKKKMKLADNSFIVAVQNLTPIKLILTKQ